MFFKETITKWESHRDSRGRVPTTDRLGRYFVLNSDRISHLTEITGGCRFRFIDNPYDIRENYSNVESSTSFATFKTYLEPRHSSKFITLTVYRENKVNRSTYDIDVLTDDISFAWSYNPDPDNYSWVYYRNDTGGMMRALCDLSLDSLLDVLTTTTTTLLPTTTELAAPDGNPSNLVLTVVSDTEIDGTFTEGSTNQDGFRVYISTDNVTFTEKTTVTSGSFQATGLTANTRYYFYVVAYRGSSESTATDTANDWTYLTEPDGWDWSLPFSIKHATESTFETSAFDLETYANITVSKTYYVDGINGNDGNSGADWDHALLTFKVAYEKADVDCIYLRDIFIYNNGSIAAYTRSMKIIGVGNNVVYSSNLGNLMSSWSEVDNHYECTVTAYSYAAIADDASNLTALGYPTRLTRVTSVAEVDATPNSFWESASAPTRTIYLRTFDGREPDSDIKVYDNAKYITVDSKTFYLENIDFDLGITVRNGTAAGGLKVYMKDCKGVTINSAGCDEAIFQNCIAEGAISDAFNHDIRNSVISKVVEIGCKAFNNGATGSDQASTSHNGMTILRINGEYHNCTGGCISETTSAKSWLLGCLLYDSSVTKIGYVSAVNAWLDTCQIYNCDNYDIQNGVGSTTYLRNCTLEKGVNDISGTLTTY